MIVTVRDMRAADKAAWVRMRYALWPEEGLATHASAVDDLLESKDDWCFIAETGDGAPIGFVEVSLRKYANGCETRPVPFVEGIWVERSFRRRRIGARLIQHVEAFLRSQGFQEVGSDTEIDNQGSHLAHRGWGFEETERVVYFRKSLNAPTT